jgi:hypothetical protein
MYAEPVTPELLKRLDNLDSKCNTLHIPSPPRTFINIKKEDPDGKVLLNLDFKANSFTYNFYKLLLGFLMPANIAYNAGYTNTNCVGKDIGGTNRNFNSVGFNGQLVYNKNAQGIYQWVNTADNIGIVIGSGNNAENKNSYSLGNIIRDSTNLVLNTYSSTNVDETDNLQYVYTLKKQWVNRTDGIVYNISEIGLYVQCYASTNNTNTVELTAPAIPIMIDRTLINTPILLDFPSAITVTYKIIIKYPPNPTN